MNRFFTLLLAASCLTAVGQVPDYVPTDGLVAWYPFNGNANDESGNGNNGTVNGASLTADRFNSSSSAFDFDGFNDFIDCGNAASIQISGALTYSAWINLDTYTNFSGVIGRGEGTGGSNAISMLMITASENKRLRFEISEGAPYESVSSPQEAIQPSNWIHVVGVWYGPDADSMAVFIDGVMSASAPSVTNTITGGTDPSDNLLKIGNRDRGSSGYSYGWFDGRIDDLGVWNRALSNDEIFGLFLSEPPNPGCTDSAACNYNFDALLDDGSCDLFTCRCLEGTIWSEELGGCVVANPSDSNFDGCVQLNDLLDLLSAYGDCSAEESPWQCGDPLEYQDYDYETVLIGEQCWFAENLRAEFYQNGDAIPSALSDSLWSEVGTNGTFTWPSHDNATEDLFGKLYNGWVVLDSRGVCPDGWKVPTSFQLTLLMNNFSDFASAGEALRDDVWWNGSNSSGFTARPAGAQSYLNAGFFVGFGSGARMWGTSSAPSLPHLHFSPSHAQIDGNWDNNYGMSIRCIKDAE